MPVQNSQFLKGEQVPSVSANKKNQELKILQFSQKQVISVFQEECMQISNALKLTFLQYWREFDLLGRNPS